MIIVVLAEDTAQGAVVSNEIQVLLESLKIGVKRGDEPDYGAPTPALKKHEEVLEGLRGTDVSVVFSRIPAKK